ncbi:MFS transporter [Neptunicella marina]|uniref:MFS transporter n=1 Tax=Neptunicella marina TaxID=2125989 RepID=A0A8J6ITG3_9ALTE|nr:MFS transporter [Neptunicella marina]MBC3765989.1 MFS transporter [Neptunicella marina]
MFKAYKNVFMQHSATLLFGMLAVFAGNVGQSFFISWYGAPIQADLNLSATSYGSIYSAATLCSGLAIMALGGWVDKMPVKRFFTLAMLGLVVACLSLWQVSGVATLFTGFLLLRFFGQGLLPHTAAVHMGRHFSINRGKALSVSGLGVPLGEVILPVLAVYMLTLSHWQQNWLWIALINLTLILPLGYWLLGHLSPAEDVSAVDPIVNRDTKPASRRTLLKDLRFWRVLPLVLMPPFAITGIFIHQSSILEGMQWSPSLFASGFVIYGVLHWLGLSCWHLPVALWCRRILWCG